MPSSKISTPKSASISVVNSAKSGESKPESLFISAFANIFIIIFIILIGVSNSLFFVAYACFICQTFCELAWSTGNTFSGIYIMKCNNYNVASMGNMNSWQHAGGHFYTKL